MYYCLYLRVIKVYLVNFFGSVVYDIIFGEYVLFILIKMVDFVKKM